MLKFTKLYYFGRAKQFFLPKAISSKIPFYSFTTNKLVQDTNSLVSTRSNKQWEKFQKEKVWQTYNFSQQNDIRTIVEKYKRFRTKLTLNEEIVFLDTLANIVANNNILFQWNQFPAIDSLLSKVKSKLKNSEEDYPLVGSLLYSMEILKFYKDVEIWLISTDYIIDRRMNSSFDELIHAFQGIANIENLIGKIQLESFLQTLEDLIVQNYSTSIIPLTNLEKICQSYSQTQRTNFDFIEMLHKSYSAHLLHKLSTLSEKDYLYLSSLIKVSYCFAQWGLITTDTSSHLQDIVESYIIANSEDLTPEVFSLLTYTLGMAIMMNKIQAKEDIVNYLRRFILNKERKYQLRQLEYLHKYLPVFGLSEDDKEIYSTIKEKLFEIDPKSTSLKDIENYIDTLTSHEYNGDFSKIPPNVLNHLDQICKIRLNEYKPKHVYRFFEFLDESGTRSGFPEFWNNLPDYIVKNIGAFDFEQMCYLYFVYVKNGANEESGKFKENLEVLKDYIVLHYRSIPRGKLDITSTFYKILEVVDIYKFYEKGEY